MNSTFYRPARESVAKSWLERVAENERFRFTAKLWRRFTHQRKDAEPHERYDYLYSAEELEPWAGRAREIATQPTTSEVYVVTKNHYRGKGIANALMLQSMVEGRVVPGPPNLFAEYGEVLAPYAEPNPARVAG